MFKTVEKLKPYSDMIVLVTAVILALLPKILSGNAYLVFTISMVMIYIVVVSGLDIAFGYCGQISLGQAGFYAVGAYVSAILSLNTNIPVLLTIFIGAAIAGLFGALFAYPASRLVHHFLALTTIGFGEIARLVFLNGGEITGAADGLVRIPGLTIGPLNLATKANFYYFILVMMIIVLLLKRNLVNSRVGRAFIAIRENIDASSAFGINISAYKTLAFSIGALLAGLSGAMYAHLVRFISPETFTGDQSNLILIMLLLGGRGSFIGAILGAVILTFGLEMLQTFGQYRMAIYGIIMLLVLFVMPRGIAGTLSSVYEIWKEKARKRDESASC